MPPLAHRRLLFAEEWIVSHLPRLGLVSGVSSLAGLAALLRSRRKLSPRVVFSSLLSSIVSGVIVYLLTVERFEDAASFHLGICALAGAGGGTTMDLLLAMSTRWLNQRALGDSDDE